MNTDVKEIKTKCICVSEHGERPYKYIIEFETKEELFQIKIHRNFNGGYSGEVVIQEIEGRKIKSVRYGEMIIREKIKIPDRISDTIPELLIEL